MYTKVRLLVGLFLLGCLVTFPAAALGGGVELDAVDIAAAQIDRGKEYLEGRNGPDEFDCSGLTWYAFGSIGIELELTALAQSTMSTGILLTNPAIAELQRGDLLFFATDDARPDLITHVGVYEGNNQMLSALSPRFGLQENALTNDEHWADYWKLRLRSARRLASHVGIPSSAFSLGDSVSVTEDGVNVRRLRQQDALGTRKSGDVGSVIFGPVRQSLGGTAHWWWKIRFGDGVEGWVAEEFLARVGAAGGGEILDQFFSPSSSFVVGAGVCAVAALPTSFLWAQSFRAGVTGRLVAVEIDTYGGGTIQGIPLRLDIVPVQSGDIPIRDTIPLDVVLGSGLFNTDDLPPFPERGYVRVNLEGAGVPIVAGVQYAIVAARPSEGCYLWVLDQQGSYAGGQAFRSVEADPPLGATGPWDFGFRTFVVPSSGAEVTAEAEDVPKAIPNPGQTVSTLNVGALGTIADVHMFFQFTHQCEHDLRMVLRAPSGSSVIVMDRGLDRCSGVSTVFTSDNQTLGPFFAGQQATGAWTLTVTDDDHPEFSGTLDSWNLTLFLQ